MADRTHSWAARPSLVVSSDQPLIGVFLEEDGREVVRYFTDELEADAAGSDEATAGAKALAGAWSHMDWDELADSLDRIRHESEPTPPIESGNPLLAEL
jgi:hypothetical protein